MRKILIPLLAVSALALPSTALAGDDPPTTEAPPEFAPPTPAPVVDVDSANAFAKVYAAKNAARFLNTDRRRVRVVDVNSACLQHPVVLTRFGCVFTLRAAVIQRRGGWNWGHASSKRRGHHPQPRVRVRNFGCLGLIRIDGGPDVTPTVTLRDINCVRVPKDYAVAAPTDS